MNKNILLKVCLCAALATILALTTHIYLSQWLNPILDTMSQGLDMNPNANTYSRMIVVAAYGTTFLMVSVLVFFYYHAQHLISGKSKWIRILMVTAIIFCLKGEPIRQPIMNVILNYNVGVKNPFLFVALQSADQWLALFLLAVCLVYLCPQKIQHRSGTKEVPSI